MNRRAFIQHSGYISASALLPGFLQACSPKNKNMPFSNSSLSRDGKVLVVIQLSGGNDGLNTFVPFRDANYYNARPQLAIRENQVIKVADNLGFNRALRSLREFYDDGKMTVLNNVGYPNFSRSHFDSSDIWHSGSIDRTEHSTGWIGRYLDSDCKNCELPYHAIEVDDTPSLIIQGERRKGFTMNDVGMLKKFNFNKEEKVIESTDIQKNNNLSYLYKTLDDSEVSADFLIDRLEKGQNSSSYPDTEFAQKLKMIAQLITTDTPTKVFFVSLNGFDTHDSQIVRHQKYLKIYADGVAAFMKDLRSYNLLDETLILTFSEFGRRVAQNASKGTDHGKANNVILFGDKLNQPGFLNGYPDLANLDNGDLKASLDFRSIYSTILEKWLEVDSRSILKQQFNTLNII